MLVQRKVTQRKRAPEPPTPPALLAEGGAGMTAHPCAACRFALPARTALRAAVPAFGCDARRRLRAPKPATRNPQPETGIDVARMEHSGIRGSSRMRRNSLCSLRPTIVPFVGWGERSEPQQPLGLVLKLPTPSELAEHRSLDRGQSRAAVRARNAFLSARRVRRAPGRGEERREPAIRPASDRACFLLPTSLCTSKEK